VFTSEVLDVYSEHLRVFYFKVVCISERPIVAVLVEIIVKY